MAKYNFNDVNSSDDEGDGLAYDLRQIYAKNIGYVLEQVAEAIEKKDYSRWFNLIDNSLYVEIYQKFDDEDHEEYKKKLTECIETISKYSAAYQGTDKTPAHIFKVNNSLKELYCLMREIMEKHKMFGEKMFEDEEGL